ncbi:hypothetical protein NEMIN01_0645 [Nematocida minor]|uniref:uncharacterized protein n=1 Tax=Nematocida minor TaxID=1912983 RepID=UPI002220A929|nr:uncharacterized protein NEMIN01_0645 [Nematocida minor]KAI5189692.1 hypothetical protein NEMIN01_0645 [Nematocida minor]
MKNAREFRAMLSTAAQYFTQNKEKYPGALDRIGSRLGSRLSILQSLPRSTVSTDQSTWGRAISNKILPALGIEGATHGFSSSSGRLIIKIPKMWESEDPSSALPVVPAAVERIFSGWYTPIKTEINLDKSILLAVVPSDE